MKVFISWSGEFSKEVASSLKQWLPRFIQSVEVFFSPDDIEKGEKWDTKLTTELNESKFGIVCLTNQNVNAPWIHFEAGALSKALDSRVSALMLNINPSDIKGPLSRFQATKYAKEDFFKLLQSINDNNDNPLQGEILKGTFEAMWDIMYAEITGIIEKYSKNDKNESDKNQEKQVSQNSQAIEDILQLLREQSNILTNPQKLLPIDYLEYINRELHITSKRDNHILEELYERCYDYFKYVLDISIDEDGLEYLNKIKFIENIRIIEKTIDMSDVRNKRVKQWGERFWQLRRRYEEILENINLRRNMMEMLKDVE